MRYIISILLTTSCLFGASPIIGYIQGIEIEPMVMASNPSPLNLPGSLYSYGLDSSDYFRLGYFVIRTSVYDQSGCMINVPVFQQNIKKTGGMPSDLTIDFIGKWSSGDGMKRKGKDDAITYPDNNGYCYSVFGCLAYGNPISEEIDMNAEYEVTIPQFPVVFALQTHYARKIGFPFFRPYMGSAWECMIGAENGVWTAWDDMTQLSMAASTPTTPAGATNEVWPSNMYSIAVDTLNQESVMNLKSYTVSFNADGGDVISFFLVGKDANDNNVYTFCTARKVENMYVSDRFLPIRAENSSVFVDANGIIYRTAQTTAGFDIKIIRVGEFMMNWLSTTSSFDVNRDGIVNWKDYVLCLGITNGIDGL